MLLFGAKNANLGQILGSLVLGSKPPNPSILGSPSRPPFWVQNPQIPQYWNPIPRSISGPQFWVKKHQFWAILGSPILGSKPPNPSILGSPLSPSFWGQNPPNPPILGSHWNPPIPGSISGPQFWVKKHQFGAILGSPFLGSKPILGSPLSPPF